MSDEEMEYSDDDFDAYYEEEYDRDVDHVDPHKNDPEYFHVACLTDTEVERLLNESVEQLSNSIQVRGCYKFLCGCCSCRLVGLWVDRADVRDGILGPIPQSNLDDL